MDAGGEPESRLPVGLALFCANETILMMPWMHTDSGCLDSLRLLNDNSVIPHGTDTVPERFSYIIPIYWNKYSNKNRYCNQTVADRQ